MYQLYIQLRVYNDIIPMRNCKQNFQMSNNMGVNIYMYVFAPPFVCQDIFTSIQTISSHPNISSHHPSLCSSPLWQFHIIDSSQERPLLQWNLLYVTFYFTLLWWSTHCSEVVASALRQSHSQSCPIHPHGAFLTANLEPAPTASHTSHPSHSQQARSPELLLHHVASEAQVPVFTWILSWVSALPLIICTCLDNLLPTKSDYHFVQVTEDSPQLNLLHGFHCHWNLNQQAHRWLSRILKIPETRWGNGRMLLASIVQVMGETSSSIFYPAKPLHGYKELKQFKVKRTTHGSYWPYLGLRMRCATRREAQPTMLELNSILYQNSRSWSSFTGNRRVPKFITTLR